MRRALPPGIAIVVPFLDHAGGTENLAWSLALRLRDAGHPPLVWTSTHLREPPAPPRCAEGIRVRRMPVLQRPPLLDLTWILPGALALALRAGEYRAIIGYHLATGGVLAAAAHSLARRPYVVVTQGAGPMGDVAALGQLPAAGLRRRLLRSAAFVTAVSADAERELAADGFAPATLRRVGTGCEVARFRPPDAGERSAARARFGVAEGDFAIVHTGRLHAMKRIDTLLAAAALLARERSVRVLLTGVGDQRESLAELASNAGLGERVHFLGLLPDQRPVLHAADVFCLPSASEGISVALLEAMSSALPVIVSDIPGNREVVTDGHDGEVVPVGEISGWHLALSRLAADRSLALGRGAAARETVLRQFDRTRNEDVFLDWASSLS